LLTNPSSGVENLQRDAIKECQEHGVFEDDLTHVAIISTSEAGNNLSIYDLKKFLTSQ
jgi:hypothetical protein